MTEQFVSAAEGIKLGLEHHQAGRLAEADQIYKQVLGAEPGNAHALFLRGTLAGQTGEHNIAVTLLTQALQNAPKNAQICLNLSLSLRELSRFKEAEEMCRRVLEVNPNLATAHDSLGKVHMGEGHLDQAVTAFQRAVALQPDSAEFHNNLGVALTDAQDNEKALTALQRAIELQPDFAEALNNYGFLLIELQYLDQAAAVLAKAVQLKPTHVQALDNLGDVLNLLARPAEAEAHFRAALELEPDDARAWKGVANAYEFLGRMDDAIAAYRKAIDVYPNAGAAYRQLADLESKENLREILPNMRNILAEAVLDPQQKIHLCYGLGRTYEKLGDWDQSSQYYDQGAKLKRATLDYDIADSEALIDRIIETFSAELLLPRDGTGCPSSVPIFIIGMPRSGTSMIEQILASHSQVYGAGELGNLTHLAHSADGTDGPTFPDTIATITADQREKLGEVYLSALTTRAPNHARVIDKMPSNFLYAGFIRMILPNAKIIHCMRNPIDTCLSCLNILFGYSQHFSYDQIELGRYYRAYRRLMDHYHRASPGWILDVHYEDVIQNQEFETQRLLEFLDLEWEDACLSFHETERPVQTASSAQVRKPMYTSSIARWKRYEAHLGPLKEALGDLVEDT